MAIPSGSYDISPGLLRQRRNVFVTSLLAIFIFAAGAKIAAVNASITTVTFERPEVIPWFLLIFQVYYLVRFYQYLHQEENLHIIDTFYSQWRGYSFQRLIKLKDAFFPDSKQYGGEFDFQRMKKLGSWRREVAVSVAQSSYGEPLEKTFEIDVRSFWLESVRAIFFVIFSRSYVTDYLLPFVVGAVGLYANVQLLVI